MKKIFLASALAASLCVPAYANFDDNSDASVYATPVYDKDINSTKVVRKSDNIPSIIRTRKTNLNILILKFLHIFTYSF